MCLDPPTTNTIEASRTVVLSVCKVKLALELGSRGLRGGGGLLSLTIRALENSILVFLCLESKYIFFNIVECAAVFIC